MNKNLKTIILILVVGLYAILVVLTFRNNDTNVRYNETNGFYIDKSANDRIELQYDTVYVCDEWKQDSLILMYKIFDAKTNMHAADNIIKYGVSGYDNEEMLIACAERDKKYYHYILDSLQTAQNTILRDSRRFDNDISYIKITGAIIRKRT